VKFEPIIYEGSINLREKFGPVPSSADWLERLYYQRKLTALRDELQRYAVRVAKNIVNKLNKKTDKLYCVLEQKDDAHLETKQSDYTIKICIDTGVSEFQFRYAEVKFADVQGDVLYIPTLRELHARVEAALNELKEELALASKNQREARLIRNERKI